MIDFIVCGAQKCGTTALDAYLRKHPGIGMAHHKEVHFFDNEAFFQQQTPNYAEYHRWFDFETDNKLFGESTPIYMYWQDSVRRIWEYNKNIKLITILRNPINRAYSHWNMEVARNAESLPFLEAIKHENERCKTALPYQHRVYSYLDRGFYSEQLRRIKRYFPQDQVLILRHEDLKNQLEATLNSVCDFLKVQHFQDIMHESVHTLPYKSDMELAAKKYLKSIFRYEIRELERMLGWDCADWMSG